MQTLEADLGEASGLVPDGGVFHTTHITRTMRSPPVIIQQRPQIYEQPAPQSEQQSYWYFCTKPEGYYP